MIVVTCNVQQYKRCFVLPIGRTRSYPSTGLGCARHVVVDCCILLTLLHPNPTLLQPKLHQQQLLHQQPFWLEECGVGGGAAAGGVWVVDAVDEEEASRPKGGEQSR
eukprot:scaffold9486_cov213-Skeletonema_marinoi.AAC.1